MTRIDRLRLRLPPQLGPHAEEIARQVGLLLSRGGLSVSGRLEHCDVGVVTVPFNAGPAEVASAVSTRVVAAVAAQLSTGAGGPERGGAR